MALSNMQGFDPQRMQQYWQAMQSRRAFGGPGTAGALGRTSTWQGMRGAAQDPTQIAAAQAYFKNLPEDQKGAWLSNNPQMAQTLGSAIINQYTGQNAWSPWSGAGNPMGAGYQPEAYKRQWSTGSRGGGYGGAALEADPNSNVGGAWSPGLVSGMYGNASYDPNNPNSAGFADYSHPGIVQATDATHPGYASWQTPGNPSYNPTTQQWSGNPGATGTSAQAVSQLSNGTNGSWNPNIKPYIAPGQTGDTPGTYNQAGTQGQSTNQMGSTYPGTNQTNFRNTQPATRATAQYFTNPNSFRMR